MLQPSMSPSFGVHGFATAVLTCFVTAASAYCKPWRCDWLLALQVNNLLQQHSFYEGRCSGLQDLSVKHRESICAKTPTAVVVSNPKECVEHNASCSLKDAGYTYCCSMHAQSLLQRSRCYSAQQPQLSPR